MITTTKIKINTISDIKTFCTLAEKVPSDVLVQKGTFIVDGKSLMGIISIDTSSGVMVMYDDSANKEFTDFVKRLEV